MCGFCRNNVLTIVVLIIIYHCKQQFWWVNRDHPVRPFVHIWRNRNSSLTGAITRLQKIHLHPVNLHEVGNTHPHHLKEDD